MRKCLTQNPFLRKIWTPPCLFIYHCSYVTLLFSHVFFSFCPILRNFFSSDRYLSPLKRRQHPAGVGLMLKTNTKEKIQLFFSSSSSFSKNFKTRYSFQFLVDEPKCFSLFLSLPLSPYLSLTHSHAPFFHSHSLGSHWNSTFIESETWKKEKKLSFRWLIIRQPDFPAQKKAPVGSFFNSNRLIFIPICLKYLWLRCQRGL